MKNDLEYLQKLKDNYNSSQNTSKSIDDAYCQGFNAAIKCMLEIFNAETSKDDE